MSAIPSIVSIGHSTHTADVFAGLLREHGVELLADVRRHPGSRRAPWSHPSRIEEAVGVPWVHLPELGGRRSPREHSPNGAWRNEQFRGYADHMASDEFAAGLARLLGLADTRCTAVMCAEADWHSCHRRLLADALVVRGWTVEHVGPRGGRERHELTPGAVVQAAGVTYPPAQLAL